MSYDPESYDPETHPNEEGRVIIAVLEEGLFPHESDMLAKLRTNYPNKLFYPWSEDTDEATYLRYRGLRAMTAVLIADGLPDGHIHYGFSHSSIYAEAMERIRAAYPARSPERNRSFVDLVSGTFDQNWGHFLTRQKG